MPSRILLIGHQWRNQHSLQSSNARRPMGYMNLFADEVHNLIDEMIIGASYTVSLHVGFAPTMAVIFREIPHEIGNFFVLLYAGFAKRRALFCNFITAIFAVLGTMISLLIGSTIKNFSAVMLPIAAGGFIYIARSDLVPELNKELRPSKSIVQMFAIATGVGLMLLLDLRE